MADGSGNLETQFNVIAAFPPAPGDAFAVDALLGLGVPRSAITVHRPDDGPTGDAAAELEADMQDELVASWGALSGAQARRAVCTAVAFGLVGIVLGALAGFGWAYLLASGLSRLSRVVILAGITGLAAATVGFVDGGSGLYPRRTPRSAGEDLPPAAERDLLVAVHLTDAVTAERAAVLLRRLGAESVHLFDGHRVPLPPQASHPRPADPEGWWWRNAGNG